MNSEKQPESAADKASRLIAETPIRWLDAVWITLATVGVLGGGGYYLDQIIRTKPWLLIAGIVIAFPVSQYLIYTRLKNRYKL